MSAAYTEPTHFLVSMMWASWGSFFWLYRRTCAGAAAMRARLWRAAAVFFGITVLFSYPPSVPAPWNSMLLACLLGSVVATWLDLARTLNREMTILDQEAAARARQRRQAAVIADMDAGRISSRDVQS